MNNLNLKKSFKKINITDYFSDAVIVINKKKFQIELLNYEAEIILGCSETFAIKKNINFFFNKTSVVNDFIESSLKEIGTYFFYDVIIGEKNIFFDIEIINPEEVNFFIVILKRKRSEVKLKENIESNHDLFQDIITKIMDRIKNPISSIKGSAQLLKDTSEKKDGDFFKIILSECNKIINLIRIFEQGQSSISIYKKRENVHQLIRMAKNDLDKNLTDKIKVIEEFDPSLPEIMVNKAKVINLLSIILINSFESIDHNHGYVKIKTIYQHGINRKLPNIQTKFSNSLLCIIIENNGPMIDVNNSERIFLPFYSSKSKERGFGLYIAKKIILEHGGSLNFDSDYDRTKFIISLPI